MEIHTQVMPPPACTPDGKCRECGESISHKGTCAWSLMRSGIAWVPQAWGHIAAQETRGDEYDH